MTLEIESVMIMAQEVIFVQVYDYSKLLGKMRERGFTQEKLAKTLGLSECSVNLTLRNKRNFRQDEISKIVDALGIDPRSIEEYFFTHKL